MVPSQIADLPHNSALGTRPAAWARVIEGGRVRPERRTRTTPGVASRAAHIGTSAREVPAGSDTGSLA